MEGEAGQLCERLGCFLADGRQVLLSYVCLAKTHGMLVSVSTMAGICSDGGASRGLRLRPVSNIHVEALERYAQEETKHRISTHYSLFSLNDEALHCLQPQGTQMVSLSLWLAQERRGQQAGERRSLEATIALPLSLRMK